MQTGLAMAAAALGEYVIVIQWDRYYCGQVYGWQSRVVKDTEAY
jgi:hypothetical protein